MTSANFFNGYCNEKPSSRVMAPPGGRSNNIFGGGYEEAPANNVNRNGTNGHSNGMNGTNGTNGANGTNVHATNGQSAPQQPQMSAQQEAVLNKQHQNGGINLFDNINGSNGQEGRSSITHSTRGSGIRPSDNSQSNIFGDTKVAPKTQVDRQKSNIFAESGSGAPNPGPAQNKQNSNNPRSGYNTITGQTYESEQVVREQSAKQYEQHKQEETDGKSLKDVHTSSRVLQPPGGRSTKLW